MYRPYALSYIAGSAQDNSKLSAWALILMEAYIGRICPAHDHIFLLLMNNTFNMVNVLKF